jgi:DHA1 family multidrug resistance protein-like MFS transporter
MFDMGQQLSLPELPWVLLSSIGLITLLALWRQFQPRDIAPAILSS